MKNLWTVHTSNFSLLFLLTFENYVTMAKHTLLFRRSPLMNYSQLGSPMPFCQTNRKSLRGAIYLAYKKQSNTCLQILLVQPIQVHVLYTIFSCLKGPSKSINFPALCSDQSCQIPQEGRSEAEFDNPLN